MKVIFTCGGTAGHVNPALALAGYMQERHPDLRVLFVGTPCGMERGLIEKAGYDFRSIEVSSFQRSLSPSGIAHNVKSLKNLALAGSRARAILRDFRPDLVVGTGGYASFPVVREAARRGIPTAVHESNMIPGLTTKLLEGCVNCVMVGFEDCRRHYKHPEKVVVTGTPVRGDFFALTKQQAREKLGYTDDKPLVASFWGSLGASTMNARMLDFFRREQADGFPFHHIHAAGKSDWPHVSGELERLKLSSPLLDVRQYIYDMAVVMAAADLVISRAGASTLSEVTALGMPTILVPSPYVVANHQEKNARLLESHGGAVVLTEEQATGEALAQQFGIPKVYTDYDAMLADPDIELVYIATPNSLHYAQTKAALLAGKNVLCEKPFVPTVAEAD